jgi:mRNA turnover protein 4
MIEFFYTWRESASLLAGQNATESVVIPKGVGSFDRLANTAEPYLRGLGLPTRVHEGKIEMLADFVVCQQGEAVNVEKAKILRLLNLEQGEMRIELKAVWHSGQYQEIS